MGTGREAQQLLPGKKEPLPLVKPLADIIVEYIALKSQEQRLQLLLSGHAALREVYSVFERHAGLHEGAHHSVAAAAGNGAVRTYTVSCCGVRLFSSGSY